MQIPRRNEQVVSEILLIAKTQLLGMWRFRRVAVSVVWFVCVIGWMLVYLMPDVYQANARVYVDTENAIEDFLGGIAASTDVMSEVTIVVREIVSRPNLAEVARNTDLALRANSDFQFEELLTSLQERISVVGSRDGIYSIAFEDTDRNKALAVVDTLLTAFVEKSLGADRTDSAQAQQFLEDQIQDYEDRLTASENRLADFKRKNVEFMPNQIGDYFERLQAAEGSLREVESALNLATERQAELLRQIEGEEPVFGIMSSSASTSSGAGGNYSSSKIRELEVQLEELRLQYTDKHPRIGQLLDTIEMLKAQEAAALQAQREVAVSQPLRQDPLDLNPVYQNMRIQLSSVDVEIASMRADRNQRRIEVNGLRTLVDTVPQVEAELNRLNRDYDVVKAKHRQLLQQLETANLGEDVSRSIDEVQFRIIDPPFSDATPVGPNRPLFLAAILVLALGAGGMLAFLMNLVNPTFFGDRSVTEVLGIPVLASVSMLLTDTELNAERKSRIKLLAAAALVIVSFTLVTIYSDQGSIALRRVIESIS